MVIFLIAEYNLYFKYKLFEIVLHERFVSFALFIKLFIYLYQCGLMDIYFILRVIIQYYFVLLQL